MRQIRPALLACAVALATVVLAATFAPPATAATDSPTTAATVSPATAGIGLPATAVPGGGNVTVPDGTTGVQAVGQPVRGDATALLVIREVPNTTNYLDIAQESVQRGDHGEASVDVGAALEMSAASLEATYREKTFDRTYGSTTNESARIDLLRAEITRVSARVSTLEERQRRAIDRFNEGEIGTSTLVRRLATIHVTAEALAGRFEHLRQRAGFSLTQTLDQRMVALETDLLALRGPVRARATSAVLGREPARTTYALTSADGLVLTTIDGNQVYREATLPSNRAPTEPNQFVTESDPSGITGANDRALELYPWAYGDAGPSLLRIGGTSVYLVTLDHSQGLLETYLDGATRSVFHERQVLRLGRIPTTTVTNETADLELTVHRTYGTGAMQVVVTDATTGAPIDGTIVVNRNRVGRTGDDGALWTITPHRQVRIVARTPEGTVNTTFFAN